MERRRLLIGTAAFPLVAVLHVGDAVAGETYAWADGPGGPGDTPPPYLGPPLKVTKAEPVEADDVVYLPLAPPEAGADEGAKLFIRLWIKNEGPSFLTITGITLAFPGSTVPSMDMAGVKTWLGYTMVLSAGQTIQWANAGYVIGPGNYGTNEVYLPMPVPPVVRVDITADGYAAPYQITFPLAPYQIAHRFPFDGGDLRDGEYILARGSHGSGGPDGGQVYAHDIGAAGWNGSGWSDLLPGTDGTKNAHYRAWNLPIRAAAAGEVILTEDATPDNLDPGKLPDPPPAQGAGNYVWLLHADGSRTVYLHMRHGTVTVGLGDTVAAGQIIGRLGNAGNSSAPHLHLEVVRQGSPHPQRPWALHDNWLVDTAAYTPYDSNSVWVPTADRGLPNTAVLVWPSAGRPGTFRLQIPEYIEIDWPPHEWWALAEQAVAGRVVPMVIAAGDTSLVSAVLRPAGGPAWQVDLDLSAARYRARLDELRRDSYWPACVTGNVIRDEVRYHVIWYREPAVAWTAYHGVTIEEHADRLAALHADGYEPVTVGVVSPGDRPQVAACYRRGDGNRVHTEVMLTAAQLDAAVSDQARAGRSLTHLDACAHAGSVRFAAVFGPMADGATTTLRHSLTADDLRAECRRRREAGQLTRALTSYTQDGRPLFAAAW